jgi:hypothetical protein
MPATPFAAIGTQLQIGTSDSPSAFTSVARIVSFSGPAIDNEQEEITTLDSTGGFKEFRSTLKSPGEITMKLYWLKGNTQHALLRSTAESGGTLYGRVLGSDSPRTSIRIAFTVKNFKIDFQATGIISVDVTLQVTGAPVWT